MTNIISFLAFVADRVLGVFVIAMIAMIVMSWLFQFGVLSRSNQFLNQLYAALVMVTDPILDPIRRVLPMGGIDLSPIVAFIVIQGVQIFFLKPLYMGVA